MLVGKRTNIPPEVWDRVFGHCERVFRGTVFLPKSRLHPLLLVCKEWYGVAERRLYSSVSLGANRTVKNRDGQKMEIKGQDVCKRFYETVQNNSRLASLVRELNLGVNTENIEETEMHVSLIGICKNVEKINIQGCSRDLAEELKTALVKVDLISLDLTTCTLLAGVGSRGGGKLYSISEFVGLLPNWPRIERVYAQLGADKWHRDEDMDSGSPVQTGACPALGVLSIYGGTLGPMRLGDLANMSPMLEELSATVQNDCGEALTRCLQIWSSSLKRLIIFTPPSSSVPRGDGCPIIRSTMVELQELWAYFPMVTPKAIALAPKLEILHFHGEHRHGMELVRHIEKGDLPRLKELDVYFLRPESENISDEDDQKICVEIAREIRKACKERGTGIFVKDLFTVTEDLEEHYGYPESDHKSLDNDWDYSCEDKNSGSPRVACINEEDGFPW